MANVKITDLTAYTDPASTDVLPIVDVGADVTKKVSIADLLKNASAGTAAAPGIAFDGDNTGIYSPGADQLAISTNGTQRISIGSDGDINIDSGGVFYDASTNRLAIGTSAPGATLHVEGLGNTVNQRIFTSDNVLNATASLTFGTTPGSRSKAAIRMINVNTGNPQGALSLLTDNGTSGLVDRLYIDGTGRVGMGDTGPDSTLTIKAATSVTPLRVSGPSSEFARIDSSGRLLVGTSSDSGGALLQVNGDRIRVATAKTPASASDTGTAGEICWDASYIYVCTATNTWKRAALSTW